MSSNTDLLKEELPAPTPVPIDLEQGLETFQKDEPEYPSGKNVALIMVSLYLAMFLVS
jgi:hypothetical protein